MFVRLAFAIQANVEPEILIVDEALAVGDAYFVHRCMLRFNELQRSGATILFVSHDANAVRNLCARAIWLAEGSIKEVGDSAKVVDLYLAHLFGRQIVTTGPVAPADPDAVSQMTGMGRHVETSIPNIDRRLGDQRCEIVGVGLYDESMNQISSSLNDRVVIVRMTVRNNNLEQGPELAVGYIFRNAKGQEIASTNSQIEGQVINSIPQGSYMTVQMKVGLPCLHQGSYAFSLTLGHIGRNGEIALSDRVENAVVFNVLTKKQVHVMMNFPTLFELEN
jgi:lipopolysaccharide transport system ATP-binding protein